MADFPASLTSFSNPTSANYLNSPAHTQQHANANDEIVALETKVGIDGSVDTASLDYKITVLNAFLLTGWVPANETWTYVSATTITVPSGAAAKYAIGDCIKITQTTVKYFYIVGVADTVLTVSGGSDYTVANAAITLNYYSHALSPVGFPDAFTYDCAPSGWAGTPTQTLSRFSIKGRTCFISIIVTGTSGGTNITLTAPITAANSDRSFSAGFAQDNGSSLATPANAAIRSASTTINVYKDGSGATWTNTGGKRIEFSAFYEI